MRGSGRGRCRRVTPQGRKNRTRAADAWTRHNRGMDRYERIIALHRVLQASRRPVTVARLQDELGCSRATVYRDLAFLRDGLMAPLVGDGEAGFGYDKNEADRFELPGLWLNS